jgi:hypothetical protein
MVRAFTISTMLLAGVLTAGISPAWAQASVPATESVTVTGFKSKDVLNKFVKSFAAPTAINGKIARWERRICPLTVGQPPALANFVTQHVKDIAMRVGAPVNPAPSCNPNIEIVFTTTPQDLLDNVRAHNADYLGYAESSTRRKELATVTRPVQAWYLTEIKDLNGMTKIDTGQRTPGGVHIGPLNFEYAVSVRRSGNLTGNGVRSAFNHIVIVVDLDKVKEHAIGPLADYIALLALTQLNSLDACQELPSIVNMLAPGCDQKVAALSGSDLAYLRGLYKMNPDMYLVVQQNEIADRMSQLLSGH